MINRPSRSAAWRRNVVLTALDSDVIKTYVELGLGVGIMAQMAFDAKRDRGLRALDASHLFESSTTRLGIKRGAYLRALRLRLHRTVRAAACRASWWKKP